MENGQQRALTRVNTIRDFTDLEMWQIARGLRRQIYDVCKRFPKDETFGLTAQMRRAAVSVTANIAEGFGRFSYQENIQFCRQSRGSTYEVRDHLITALDQGYISREDFETMSKTAISVIRLLNGYIRATSKRKRN